MELPEGFLGYLWQLLVFVPVFMILFVIGIVKAVIIGPIVLLVIIFGNWAVVIGLWPLHVIWTYYCVAKTKKFGTVLKGLLFLTLPIPLLLWPLVGLIGSLLMGLGYGFFWPLMATFEAIGEGVPNKLVKCFTDGTWSNVWGACTIVRDFGDFSFHSYFSVMDELLEAKDNEKPLELKVTQIPGCILAAILGILVDVPIITLIVAYKAPILLFKGWKRLSEDLVGRSGPFLETVCVPIAGLLILLWPFAVFLAILAGILSSVGFGCYAAVVAYQENSTKRGLLYVVASVSLFDECTNDFLYLREGSCFPRPKYREGADSSPLLPLKGLHEQIEAVHGKRSLIRTPSERIKALKAVVIWDNFFEACEGAGKELLRDGAIGVLDLEAWQSSKSKIVNIGIPAYAFLGCFLQSIKSGSTGFVMRGNVEVTGLNRPEGRVFDWLFEPMCVMKEQIKSLNLLESEELYLFKLALYCGDTQRVEAWHNGGVPPYDEIRRAQLEGISRRLQGFCLTLSRLPTFRRRLYLVVNALINEMTKQSSGYGETIV
ncbi:hypothetical protein BVC80_8893g17 [Macleaya cordata]|uniref:Transmembrane protein n=1 Tax=Macleaya cordata TaxID=56857 RepID=A0A200Q3Y7_MACCD|nr:hypothetical protein BVC80_8893g17 [Macleaya cordata]